MVVPGAPSTASREPLAPGPDATCHMATAPLVSTNMRRGLTAVVLAHLGISIVHGWAHNGARVDLSPGAMLFVYVVILAGPLAGLVVMRWRASLGAALVAATMTGALLFGVVNHFVIAGSDHVAHVAAAWRPLFGLTAALLALTEAAAAAMALRYARARSWRAS